MDLLIRYWSPTYDEAWCHYYCINRCFFANSRGEMIAEAIHKSLKDDNLPIKMLLALGSDGPNVNKTIWRAIDKKLMDDSTGHGLIDIGICNIHVIHNAFAKGLAEFGSEIEELAMDLYSLFKHSAARREDYKEFQLD